MHTDSEMVANICERATPCLSTQRGAIFKPRELTMVSIILIVGSGEMELVVFAAQCSACRIELTVSETVIELDAELVSETAGAV